MPIPRTLWQTARSHDLPPTARSLVDGWVSKNPRWHCTLFDDEEIDDFIATQFGRPLLDAFRAMPIPVMRADIWRYAVIYANGGVYADIDAECVIPLDDWLHRDAEAVIGLEDNDLHFCQWTFAAAPGAALLGHALDLVVDRWNHGIDTSRKHFVHYHTGPGLWTDAVRRLLGTGGDARKVMEAGIETPSNILFLDTSAFNGEYVRHHTGSQRWRRESGYSSWLDDRERVFLFEHARPRRQPAWSLRHDGAGFDLVHQRYGRRMSCSESAAWVFSRCDGERTPSEMLAELHGTLTEVPADLEVQLYTTLKLLRRRKLIRF